MKLQSITLLCLLLPTALTYGMIVPISGNIDEASNSLYYDSNPRQFVWLLPQMYAGMSADTAFQISLSVTPNISANTSIILAIYTKSQQNAIYGTSAILNPDKYAWPAFKRYELSASGTISKSLTISKKLYYYPALLLPLLNTSVSYSGQIAYRAKDGSFLSTDDWSFMNAMLALTVAYTAVATAYTVIFSRSPLISQYPLPRTLLFSVWLYALTFAVEFIYYCTADITGYQYLAIHYVSAIAKAAAETWLFLFALSISLGWSLLSDQLDGRQIVFLCSPFLYFIAGTCMPFYWNGTTTSSESYALILLAMVFFRLVVCFWLYVATHAMAMIYRQRTAAVEQSQNLTDKRQLNGLINSYFRLRFLITIKNIMPLALMFPVLSLFMQVLFVSDPADRWITDIAENCAILLFVIRIIYMLSPRNYDISGTNCSATAAAANRKPPKQTFIMPQLFLPRASTATLPRWSLERIVLSIIYPAQAVPVGQ